MDRGNRGAEDIIEEVLLYKSEKGMYTVDEQKLIKTNLRNKLANFFKDLGNSLVEGIDEINRQ
jgi:hypothetical protein